MKFEVTRWVHPHKLAATAASPHADRYLLSHGSRWHEPASGVPEHLGDPVLEHLKMRAVAITVRLDLTLATPGRDPLKLKMCWLRSSTVQHVRGCS